MNCVIAAPAIAAIDRYGFEASEAGAMATASACTLRCDALQYSLFFYLHWAQCCSLADCKVEQMLAAFETFKEEEHVEADVAC